MYLCPCLSGKHIYILVGILRLSEFIVILFHYLALTISLCNCLHHSNDYNCLYHWIMSILSHNRIQFLNSADIYKLMIWQKYVLKYLVEQTFVLFSLTLLNFPLSGIKRKCFVNAIMKTGNLKNCSKEAFKAIMIQV